MIVAIVIAASLVGLYLMRKGRVGAGIGFVAVACLAIAAHGLIYGTQTAKDAAATIVFGIVGLLLISAWLVFFFMRRKKAVQASEFDNPKGR